MAVTHSPGYRAALTTYLAPHKRTLVALGVVLLVSIGLQLVVPIVLSDFIDSVLVGEGLDTLTGIGVAFLVAGVTTQVLEAISAILGARVGWDATNTLREDLAEHLLGLDMGFHTDTTPGEIIERVDGDVTALAEFLSRFTVRLAGAGVLLVGVVIVSFVRNLVMGAVLGVYVVALLALLYRVRSLAVAAAEEERETSAGYYGFVEERLAGIDDIRANGAGRFTMARFGPVMIDFYDNTVRAWLKRVVVWVTANTAFWTGDAIALALGVWLFLRGSVTVGTAYLVIQYVALVRRPIEQITQQLQELQKAAGGLIRVDALRQVTTKVPHTGSRHLPEGPLSIEFDSVTFAYEAAPVLREVSFVVPAGKVLGLLGRTGGGKSTITRLISRLYDPVLGSVILGGVDLRDVDAASLRHSVGVVTQDVQLFGATIRDNLTFFDRSRTDDEILAVLDRAGLGDWIRTLGLDKKLGSSGAGLSAGEQQLLAFSRVFLQDPQVVILDEPSSRLDPATESRLAAAAERLFSGRTVVVVAHRLDTVRRSDLIMVVEAGRVVEYGDREALHRDPASRYARLLAAGAGTELA
ncbi:MAG: ABC transporter ATP-binding protein [Acidimicrobiia bacterium]